MAKKRKIASSGAKLNAKAFGCSCGVLWGLGVLILGIVSTYTGYGEAFVTLLGSVYLGFKLTIGGAIIGGIWALVDGFIGGYIFAWLYNKCLKCC